MPVLCLNALTVLGQGSLATSNLKPYRALLVVERWNHPNALLVDSQVDEFQPIAALLKAWLVPFDILRLDQQHIDASYLFGRSGKVRYGVVIWLADLSSYEGHNFETSAKPFRVEPAFWWSNRGFFIHVGTTARFEVQGNVYSGRSS